MILLALILSFIIGGEHTDWDLAWVGDEGYVYDGVEPDYAYDDSVFTFRIKLRGISQPIENIWLYLDTEGNGQFSPVKRMVVEKSSDDGYIYKTSVRISPPKQNKMISYYFTAQIGGVLKSTQVTFGPLFKTKLSFKILTPWVWEPSFNNPLQVVVSREQERYLLQNDGDVPLRFGLVAVAGAESDWLPATNFSEIGEDKFILSAVFSTPGIHDLDIRYFNRQGLDDVIGLSPKFSNEEFLGIDRDNPGARVEPGDTVALWFLLQAPLSASFEKPKGYSIFIKIIAIPTK